jgi:4-hydroxybenzoate polyprenyltransferase
VIEFLFGGVLSFVVTSCFWVYYMDTIKAKAERERARATNHSSTATTPERS